MPTGRGRVAVELLVHSGCPNAARVHETLTRCLTELGLRYDLLVVDGDHPSPTVRVNGTEVMGREPVPGRSCRTDVPSETDLRDALVSADP